MKFPPARQIRKALTPLVTGVLGWVAVVLGSAATGVTGWEWLGLAGVVATSFGVYKIPNASA